MNIKDRKVELIALGRVDGRQAIFDGSDLASELTQHLDHHQPVYGIVLRD